MSTIVRFGVSLEKTLLEKWDSLLKIKGYNNRSEALRDLIRAEMVKAGNSADVHKRMTDDGATMVLSTPAEFGAVIKTEISRWRRLLQEAGTKPTEE